MTIRTSLVPTLVALHLAACGPTKLGTIDLSGGSDSGGGSGGGGSSGGGGAISGGTRDCAATPGRISAPIVVNDSGNTTTRDPPLTSFLVPLARSTDLHSTAGLVVSDAMGHRLPAQFETLSRWGGGRDDCTAPIRFAYAHVGAVPAPGASATWTVTNDPSAGASKTALQVTETAASWTIDTGAARFTVRRDRFEGLSRVEVTGGGGSTVVSDLGATGGQHGFLLDRGANGLESTTSMTPWRLALERSGPAVATVVARGYYATQGGKRDFGYTVRLHFVAGSATVRIDHTYYYGDVAGYGVDGLTNTAAVNRAYLSIPLAGGAASAVVARADDQVRRSGGSDPVQLQQVKRGPGAVDPAYQISVGGSVVESGVSANHPFLAVQNGVTTALATVARLAQRDPQGLRFDPATRALQIDFTSSPMQIGAARGIWSVAAVDFGTPGADPVARAAALQLHAERPLLGTPQPDYVNGTGTIGPYASKIDPRYSRFFTLAGDFHQTTRGYIDQYRIYGLQLWPDLPRTSCMTDGTCTTAAQTYFDGGDNNYWNWSKVGLDEFFRTGRNEFAWDFSIGEAVTFAETLAIRPDHDRLDVSGETGLAPCYGSAKGYSGVFTEGLNARKDRCPSDYTYNKTLKLAYLATGDQRFIDYFEEAGQAMVQSFGSPPPEHPQPFSELSIFRLSEQRLENLANGAEFAGDPAVGDKLRSTLGSYLGEMFGRVLIDGHACNTAGTRDNSALDLGQCNANQAWMMPVPVEWMVRTSRVLGHQPLADFIPVYARTAAEQHTVLDAKGFPDYGQLNASSSDNARNGWRTVYSCRTSGSGIDATSCQKSTNIENDGYFYGDGVVAFLNIFGLTLAANPADPNHICTWLPGTYQKALGALSDDLLNGHVWGKVPGQAFGMSAEAIGALTTYCH